MQVQVQTAGQTRTENASLSAVRVVDSVQPNKRRDTSADRPLWYRHATRGAAKSAPLAVLVAGAVSVVQRIDLYTHSTIFPYDAYYYLGTAQSLAYGLGYQWRGLPHTRFFPGYPIFVALLSPSVGLEYASVLVAAASWALVGLVAYGIAAKVAGRAAGLVAGLLTVYHPLAAVWTSVPMSEGFFTLACFLSLFLAVRAVSMRSWRYIVLASASAGIAVATRGEGVLLYPLLAACVAFLWKQTSKSAKQARKLALATAVSVVLSIGPLVLWCVWQLSHPSQQVSYLSELQQGLEPSLSFVMSRAWYYLFPAFGQTVITVAGYAGLVLALKRDKPTVAILASWLALLAGFHSFWYYRYDRFALAAVPVLCVGCGAVARAVLDLGKRLAERAAEQATRARQSPVAAYVALGMALIVAAVALQSAELGNSRARLHMALLGDNGGDALVIAAKTAGKLEGNLASNAGAIVEYHSGKPTLDLVAPISKETLSLLPKAERPCAVAIGCYDPDQAGHGSPEQRLAKLESSSVRYLVLALGGNEPRGIVRALGLPPERFEVVAMVGQLDKKQRTARRAAVLRLVPPTRQ